MSPSFDIVVPTAGRPSLARLLEALGSGNGPLPGRLIVVFDGHAPRALEANLGRLSSRLIVLASGGRGPAAARNAGWREATSEWVAFLDDDVVPPTDWTIRLAGDLEGLTGDIWGSQGRVRVPLEPARRPTDWERNVKGLESAVWATADMAFRRRALAQVGGFDERFARAYREDADLGLRIHEAGGAIVRGDRCVEHPPRPGRLWTSVRLQAGNADDVLMLALHGPGWRRLSGSKGGRRPLHLTLAGAFAVSAGAAIAGRRRLAAVAGALYGTGVAELSWSRIAPGPRDAREVLTMAATSALLPLAASAYWVAGWIRLPWLLRRAGPRPEGSDRAERSDPARASVAARSVAARPLDAARASESAQAFGPTEALPSREAVAR